MPAPPRWTVTKEVMDNIIKIDDNKGHNNERDAKALAKGSILTCRLPDLPSRL